MAIGAAAIGLGIQGAKALVGGIQALKGRKMLKNNKRPTYEIPEEIKQNLNAAKLREIEGLPEAQRQAAVNDIKASQAAALAGGNDRQAGISGLAGGMNAANSAYANIANADVAARQSNQAGVTAANSVMAGFKDKAFSYNKDQPFQAKQAEGQGLVGSGMQNIAGALDSAGSILMQRIESGEDPATVLEEGKRSGEIDPNMTIEQLNEILNGGGQNGLQPPSTTSPYKGFRGSTPYVFNN